MMHTYIRLRNTTDVCYGAQRPDGSAPVWIVRAHDGDYAVAMFSVPGPNRLFYEGFDEDELVNLERIVASNTSAILELAAAGAQDEQFEWPTVNEGQDRPKKSSGPAMAPKTAQQPADAQGSVAPPQVASSHPNATYDYQQAASAVLDAANLIADVAPSTKASRVVRLAMPAARVAVASAPQIIEKATPAVNQAARTASVMVGKVVRGIGALGTKVVRTVGDVGGRLVAGVKHIAEKRSK